MTEPSAATPPGTGHDPFVVPTLSPRGRGVLVAVAAVAAVLAVGAGLAPVAGPFGMGAGLLAHLKGSRLGMPATVVAGIATILGFAVTFLLR